MNQSLVAVLGAFGFHSRLTDCVRMGAACEIPLIHEDTSLMESRVTTGPDWKF